MKKLSPKTRNQMVHEVLEQNQPIAQVAKKFDVSRVTLYKWIQRAKEEKENGEQQLLDRERVIDRYWRQTPQKHEEAILSLISKHPEWGIRTLVKNLPRVGNTPIVGHHGVQNVLRRHNLSTYEDRVAYIKSLRTPVLLIIESILSKVANFFKLPVEKRHSFVQFFGIFALSLFTTIVVTGLGSYVYSGSIGTVFALIALIMGSIFFLYSLKYYITLAIVLSYSQKEGSQEKAPSGFGGFLDRIINSTNSDSSSVGLNPDLSNIRLKNKPFVSVHIPFFNEKNVADRAIHAAVSFDYPEYEVILCDDSTDETTQIVRKRMKRYLFSGEKLKIIKGDGWELAQVEVKPGVTLKHLHRTSREGFKGAALKLALSLVNPKTEFVSVFDADFVPYPDSLTLFLKYFKSKNNMSEDYKNTNIAAVQGYQWHVLNKSENWVTRGVRSEYAGSYVIERSGTEVYGGLKQISGSVYMIRRDILQKIGWGRSITEDFELTLKLYREGYKVVYTPYIQAPAECASTLRRLIRQRMRWAEGHSQNIKKNFLPLISSSKLTLAEKLEFLYLSPYYLQAFFFLVGTFSWLVSEAVFRARLPFWTELWGWSLVLTNMISLPLVNAVGLFLEESEERDYMGLGSFMALSYILVPFQAYAAVKGFLQSEEGGWFRTPKTGVVTDVFKRGQFYRFIQGILPKPAISHQSLAISHLPNTANHTFDKFNIKKAKNRRWVGKVAISVVLILTTTIYSLSKGIPEVLATSPTGTFYLRDEASSVLTGTGSEWRLADNSVDTSSSVTTVTRVNNKKTSPLWFQYKPGVVNSTEESATSCASNTPDNGGWIFETPFGTGGQISSGSWTFYINETDNRSSNTGTIQVCIWKVSIVSGVISSPSLLFGYNDSTNVWNGGVNNFSFSTGTVGPFSLGPNQYLYVEYFNNLSLIASSGPSTDYDSVFRTGPSYSNPRIVTPSITIPENAILYIISLPFVVYIVFWLKKKTSLEYA